jgi:hypothetical protein
MQAAHHRLRVAAAEAAAHKARAISALREQRSKLAVVTSRKQAAALSPDAGAWALYRRLKVRRWRCE